MTRFNLDKVQQYLMTFYVCLGLSALRPFGLRQRLLKWGILGLGLALLWHSPAIATDVPIASSVDNLKAEITQNAQMPDVPGVSKPLSETEQAFSLPAPKVAVNYQYYTIKGRSVNDLYEQMQINSPSRSTPNWYGFAALTDWQVYWSSSYAESDQGCTLQAPSVKVIVNTTLPRWQTAKSAKTEVRKEWQRYFDALSTHEKGHQRNGMLAGEAVQQFLQTSPSAPACHTLVDKMNKAVQEVIAEYRRKDRTYDRLTQHGSTQGAILNRTVG